MLHGSYVTVGVHEDAGTYEAEPGKEPVPVSKVGWWLENGTQNMPARPFFYPTLAHYRQKIARLKAQGAAAVAYQGVSIELALARQGFAVQSWVQNAIKSNVPPSLTRAYLRRRKKDFPESGSRTLIASGLLLRSVRYKVSIKGGAPEEGPAEGPEPLPLPSHNGQKHDTETEGAQAAKALARELARQASDARKAAKGFQRLAAKLSPERQKREFAAQRRAYKPFRPKAKK